MSEEKETLEQKMEFVEPTISAPVDVLEATAFFQVVGPAPSGEGDVISG